MQERLLPLMIFGVALLVALVLRHIVLRWVYKRATEKLTFAFVFLNSIRIPSVLWCLAAALALAIRNAPLADQQVGLASKWIGAFIIISVSLAGANILVRMFAVYGEKHEMPFAVAGLSRTLVHVVVWTLGALALLRHFDISITPLLTALGVGGLAVALALQDTLANFFAGVHILVETPIGVGDFVKLSSGEEGVVSDIGWRTTRILTGGHSTIVIPNTKITSGILTNFNMPDRRVTAEIAIVARLDANPNEIAELAMDVASQAENVMADPAPVLLFDPGVLPTHMQFKLIVNVANPLIRGPVQSSIRVALLEGFRRRGIPLPELERRLDADRS